MVTISPGTYLCSNSKSQRYGYSSQTAIIHTNRFLINGLLRLPMAFQHTGVLVSFSASPLPLHSMLMLKRGIRIARLLSAGQLRYMIFHKIGETLESLSWAILLVYLIKPAIKSLRIAVNEAGNSLAGDCR